MARQDALSSATTLELMIGDYLDWHALRCSARRHCRDVKRELLRFAVTVGTDVPIAQVTREHCTAFLCGFQERDCKPNTLNENNREKLSQ